MPIKTPVIILGDDPDLDAEGRAILARELGIADVFQKVTIRAREIEGQFPRRGDGGITTTRRA